MDVNELRQKRYNFLKFLYEKLHVNQVAVVPKTVISKEITLLPGEALSIARFLQGEGWLEILDDQEEFVSITHEGIKYVEAPQSTINGSSNIPQQVTNNNITIQQMTNSQIQQGNNRSTQSVTFTSNGSIGLLEFVQLLKKRLPELDLSQDDRLEIEAEVATVEAQLSSNKPKPQILTICMDVIKDVLKRTASTALATELLGELSKIHF